MFPCVTLALKIYPLNQQLHLMIKEIVETALQNSYLLTIL